MQTQSAAEPQEATGRRHHRQHALVDKRRIVELCLKPGASVAGVALAHGVNANLVRKWIGKYRAGEYGELAVPLLPVSVRPGAGPTPITTAASPKSSIDIELPGARVRIEGRVDAETLRIVLGSLAR